MKIVSVNIGEKRQINYKGRSIETGIFKFPVTQPTFVDFEGIKEDVIIDKKHHGGIEKAVYAYGENHYNFWKNLYPDLNWRLGMFGENLTISNLNETEIFIGDTFKIGEVIVEVSKPREPCMKLGLVFETQKIVKQFWNSTKCGVYFKVIQTGKITLGDELVLLKKGGTVSIAKSYLLKR